MVRKGLPPLRPTASSSTLDALAATVRGEQLAGNDPASLATRNCWTPEGTLVPCPEATPTVSTPNPSPAHQRAAEIDNLMSQPPLSKQDQRRIRDIFCAINDFGTLLRLQLLVNLGGNRYDLEKLIYHDICDKKIRQEILDHFQQVQPPPGTEPPLLLLSDIDDTILYGLKDERYEATLAEGDLYPDVISFIHSASSRVGGLIGRSHYITFMTARPEALLEDATLEKMAGKGLDSATALSGRLGYLLSSKLMGKFKVRNFEHQMTLLPHCRFLFVGDNGQGDVLLADHMMKLARDPECPLYGRVPLCLIQKAIPHDATKNPNQVASEETLAHRGIYLFDDYAEALTIAQRFIPNDLAATTFPHR